MSLNIYLAAFIFLYIAAYCFYVKISHNTGRKKEYLQLRRFFPCALCAVLPAAVTDLPLNSGLYVICLIVGLAWIITYPTLYYITNHNTDPEFAFPMDTAFGLYAISWLASLEVLVLTLNTVPVIFLTVISFVEFILLLIPLLQYCYYYLYNSCIDENGMMLLQDTDYNEVIEFLRSLPSKFVTPVAAVIGLTFLFLVHVNLSSQLLEVALGNVSLLTISGLFIFLTVYIWKKANGVFIRTGIIRLFINIRKYTETSRLYKKNMEERINDLYVSPPASDFDKPSTFILIIGESASRDYMSAFTNYPQDSTPWLRSKKSDKHFILFPNSYSSMPHTELALERALTEFNQYNDKKFYTSISIIDIARKAGYKTYWYSNQGHLGASDTPITLIADTADTAKWTKQNINRFQYDENLLEYLSEVNPKENNFVVLHLSGSHFNFINRYPKEFTKWGEPGKYDIVLNYLNSLAYTDLVIKKIYDYATEKLNLQAMIYFSDHATLPDKLRSPNFSGFGEVRIPMFACFSDEYIEKNKSVYETLKLHEDYYFTNDLVYEMICSIFGISSNHFDETSSLASPKYKYTKETLLTNLGKTSLKDDNN